MYRQAATFLQRLDGKVFEEPPSLIVIVRGKINVPKGIAPVSHFRNQNGLDLAIAKALRRTAVPDKCPFYLVFADLIESSVKNTQKEHPKIHPTLTLWALCVDSIWHKAQLEQIEKIKACEYRAILLLDTLLLRDEEMCECVKPFIPASYLIDVEELRQSHEKRIVESWEIFEDYLMKKSCDDVELAVWRNKRNTEVDVISSFTLWCQTEDNVVAFLKKCKKVLFAKAESFR